MSDYDDGTRLYALMRRIIVVAAVLAAIPVVWWTITTYVRAYYGPPQIPTFRQTTKATADAAGAVEQPSTWQIITTYIRAHVWSPQISFPGTPSTSDLKQLASGATKEAEESAGARQLAAVSARAAAAAGQTPVEPGMTATDSRDLGAAPNAPSAAGRTAAAAGIGEPTTAAARSADPSAEGPATAKAMEIPAARGPNPTMTNAAPPKPDAGPPWPQSPQPNGAQQPPPPWPEARQTAAMSMSTAPAISRPNLAQETAVLRTAAQQIAAGQHPAAQQAADAAAPVPTADAGAEPQPLSGKIPLPRHRPSDLVMEPITAANVPMPRSRPDIAAAGVSSASAATEGTSAGPLDFLQNLFH
jgi:hypothetical protein